MNDLWYSLIFTAFSVLAWALMMLFAPAHRRYLKRFSNSPRAGQLYVFSWGILAVTFPLALTDAFNSRAAGLFLVLFYVVPFVIAEVLRSRADRRARQAVNQVSVSSEVTP